MIASSITPLHNSFMTARALKRHFLAPCAVLHYNTAMPRNTSITLGEHFTAFVNAKLKEGRYETVSEVVRAGLRRLEEDELKLQELRAILAVGHEQILRGETVDGPTAMQTLIERCEP